MKICFVIQPFDRGKYDKRYEDIYKPAIIDANLEPYRVDKDYGADVPIDAIEEGIRSSLVCLADISTDNPNVWYELGFAFASGKSVVMLCGAERPGNSYPFDIRHRTVTPYQTESSSDFEELRKTITARLEAMVKKNAAMKEISNSDKVAPVDGLTQYEMIVLASAAGNAVMPGHPVSMYTCKRDVERSGFTALAFSLGVRSLARRWFLEVHESMDINGEPIHDIVLMEPAWQWIEQNETKFLMRQEQDTPVDDSSDYEF